MAQTESTPGRQLLELLWRHGVFRQTNAELWFYHEADDVLYLVTTSPDSRFACFVSAVVWVGQEERLIQRAIRELQFYRSSAPPLEVVRYGSDVEEGPMLVRRIQWGAR
jgi:hypothetical protein